MVYTKMAIKIEATKELVQMIDRSAKEWKAIKFTLDDQLHYYDVYANETFGLKVDFNVFDDMILVTGAEIIDDEKYMNFLLRYGNMHDE